MGKLIRLTGVNFSGAPKLKQFDEIETFGSLFLMDVSAISSIPSSGGTTTNILRTLTQQLTGSGTNLDFIVRNKTADNANWKLEKTSKGGIHGIVKQNTGNTSDISFVYNCPRAVRNYILANPNRNYYVSIWCKVTKAPLPSPAVQSNFHFCTDNSGGTNGFFNSGGGRFNDAGGNRSNAVLLPNIEDGSITNPPLDRFNSAQYSGIVNNGQTLTSSHDIQLGLGAFGPWGSFNAEKGASKVLYRAYMEDLTASGRTAAEVSAIDKAMFDKAFAVGGRFYNDTYTDPNSI